MSKFSFRRLEDVADFLSGGTPAKSELRFWGGSIPWLTPKDMSTFDGTTTDYVTDAAISNGTRIAPSGSLFVAVRGMSLHNEIRILRSEKPIAFNQDIKAIVPRDIDGQFLFYSLCARRSYLLSSVEAAGHGTGRLPTDKLAALEIPNIPPDEQRAIAYVLGSLDDKIEINRRMNETLEATARTLFKDWFVDFGPVRAKMEGRRPYGLSDNITALFPNRLDTEGKPVGWEILPLDEIADFLNGLALQKFPGTAPDDLPVIKIAELRAGFAGAGARAAKDIPSQYVIKDGDTIFSWSGSLIQRIWTGGRGALNQHLFKVTSKRFPKWLHYYWVEHYLPSFQAIAASKATTMGHIQRHHLTEAKTIIGSTALMEAANAVFAPLFDRIVANNLESRTLAELRDLLLPKLVSGEIRIKDAEQLIGDAL